MVPCAGMSPCSSRSPPPNPLPSPYRLEASPPAGLVRCQDRPDRRRSGRRGLLPADLCIPCVPPQSTARPVRWSANWERRSPACPVGRRASAPESIGSLPATVPECQPARRQATIEHSRQRASRLIELADAPWDVLLRSCGAESEHAYSPLPAVVAIRRGYLLRLGSTSQVHARRTEPSPTPADCGRGVCNNDPRGVIPSRKGTRHLTSRTTTSGMGVTSSGRWGRTARQFLRNP
jgi:hypothetical protein